MMMLYTYKLTISHWSYHPSDAFTFDRMYSIIADTSHDRRTILNERFNELDDVPSLIRSVLIAARVLTRQEIKLLEAADWRDHSVQPPYLLYVKDHEFSLARQPRLVTQEYRSAFLNTPTACPPHDRYFFED